MRGSVYLDFFAITRVLPSNRAFGKADLGRAGHAPHWTDKIDKRG